MEFKNTSSDLKKKLEFFYINGNAKSLEFNFYFIHLSVIKAP